MNRPPIRVHIDRLVLHGLTLSAHDVGTLTGAFEEELARQLRHVAVRDELSQGAALSTWRVPPVVSTPSPSDLGRSVARALGRSLLP
jgi:hypothetical protein